MFINKAEEWLLWFTEDEIRATHWIRENLNRRSEMQVLADDQAWHEDLRGTFVRKTTRKCSCFDYSHPYQLHLWKVFNWDKFSTCYQWNSVSNFRRWRKLKSKNIEENRYCGVILPEELRDPDLAVAKWQTRVGAGFGLVPSVRRNKLNPFLVLRINSIFGRTTWLFRSLVQSCEFPKGSRIFWKVWRERFWGPSLKMCTSSEHLTSSL